MLQKVAVLEGELAEVGANLQERLGVIVCVLMRLILDVQDSRMPPQACEAYFR